MTVQGDRARCDIVREKRLIIMNDQFLSFLFLRDAARAS